MDGHKAENPNNGFDYNSNNQIFKAWISQDFHLQMHIFSHGELLKK